MFFKTAYDFVAIGELAVDAFIRLEDNGIRIEGAGTGATLCLPFATKIPYASVNEIAGVANAGNAAVSASRLGLKSALVANIGADENGNKCLSSLKKDGVDPKFIRAHKNQTTNYHYILWFDKDRTILQKHTQFPYNFPQIGDPKWIYLTSLGESSLEFHTQIGDFLEKNKDVKMAFQPGIFQIKFGTDVLKKIYERTDIFCCNVEEAQVILKEESHDVKVLSQKISKLGPKIVLITDGIDGAYAYESASPENFWYMPVYPHVPFERTGAGDAFFSTVVSYLAMGRTLQEALLRGPINSMSVVQKIGAQEGLLSAEKIEEYLKNAPADYTPRKI